MKSRKGATSFSILLLVIMALVLSAAALLAFNIREKNFQKKIFGARVIEDVYVIEEKIKFYMFEGKNLQEAISLVDNAKQEVKIIDEKQNKVEVRKKIKNKYNKIEIIYQFQAG